MFIVVVDIINCRGLICALHYFGSEEEFFTLLVGYSATVQLVYHGTGQDIAVVGEELFERGALFRKAAVRLVRHKHALQKLRTADSAVGLSLVAGLLDHFKHMVAGLSRETIRQLDIAVKQGKRVGIARLFIKVALLLVKQLGLQVGYLRLEVRYLCVLVSYAALESGDMLLKLFKLDVELSLVGRQLFDHSLLDVQLLGFGESFFGCLFGLLFGKEFFKVHDAFCPLSSQPG